MAAHPGAVHAGARPPGSAAGRRGEVAGPASGSCRRRRPPLLPAALRPTGSDHGRRPLVTGALVNTLPRRRGARRAARGRGRRPLRGGRTGGGAGLVPRRAP